MKQFVWLNPVSMAMYGGPQLLEQLMKKGFEPVECQVDHIAAVREKYRQAVRGANGCVADVRCPLAVAYIKERYAPDFLEYPKIEPILLHCARELQRKLSGQGTLIITTPCQSLKELGAGLKLPETEFFTFLELAAKAEISLRKKDLEESPIPPGFFEEFGDAVRVLGSRDKIDRYFSGESARGRERLLELLYCAGGCHRGDGVQGAKT